MRYITRMSDRGSDGPDVGHQSPVTSLTLCPSVVCTSPEIKTFQTRPDPPCVLGTRLKVDTVIHAETHRTEGKTPQCRVEYPTEFQDPVIGIVTTYHESHTTHGP